MWDTTARDEGPGRAADSTCKGGSESLGQRRGIDSDSTTQSRLIRVVEGEIIPRLLRAAQRLPVNASPQRLMRTDEEIAAFARLTVSHDISAVIAHVEGLLARGAALDGIYLDLLAPAARLLGEWWTQDVRDFSEVTIGLCRMHQLLHEFSPQFVRRAASATRDRQLLLTPMPGEQHSFGLIMVAEFFRRKGWDVWDLQPTDADVVLSVVHQNCFAVVGVSLACPSRLDEVRPLIRRIRGASRNPDVVLMVGGHPFSARPELVQLVGADGTARDGECAAEEASRLVDRLGRLA